MDLGEFVTTLIDSLRNERNLANVVARFYKDERVAFYAKKVAKREVVKKLGRGSRHLLAPRLRELAAAAIGVREIGGGQQYVCLGMV